MRRKLRPLNAPLPFAARGGFADNDQKPVWNWDIVAAPWHYAVSLRRNKVRAMLASASVR